MFVGMAMGCIIFLGPNCERLNRFDSETQINSDVFTRCGRVGPLPFQAFLMRKDFEKGVSVSNCQEIHSAL